MSPSHAPPDSTPTVFAKTLSDQPWPDDERLFYLVAREGLFICRNHEFFRSSQALSHR